MPEEKVRVPEALDRIYAQVDPKVEHHAKLAGVTCRKGCSHCCKLLAIITIADGVYLADELLKRADWKDWLPRLVTASKEFCYEGINSAEWFAKQVPCVFLKDNMCSVYSKRPSACRYYMVVSPPENCAKGAVNGTTMVLDLFDVESQTSWAIALGMSSGGLPLAGPIPLMTLHAMTIVAHHEYPDRVEEIGLAARQVPTPNEWLERYGENVVSQGTRDLDARRERGL